MITTDILEGLLHFWPIIWSLLGGLVGWMTKALRDYHQRDKTERQEREADRESIKGLTRQVTDIKTDLEAIKAGNVAEYQESISNAHRRYVTHHEPLTIASRGRVNAMMRSLSALDDEDGTFRAMVDDINELPIYQPSEEG